jgi:Fis family transcriptional regulator
MPDNISAPSDSISEFATASASSSTPSGNTEVSGSTQNNFSKNLFVANLQAVSLERLVRSKLEVLFNQKEFDEGVTDLYAIVLSEVEKPLIELALKKFRGNQVRTAQMLGINRNTLKKKMHLYKIQAKGIN